MYLNFLSNIDTLALLPNYDVNFHTMDERKNIQASIAPSARDALLGDWMIIVNRVFEENIDLRNKLFDAPFKDRLKGTLITFISSISSTYL